MVCWIAALAFGMLMYHLALAAGADRAAARRAAWLSQLAPGAFVLVMGYTEALAGMCAAAFLIALRFSGARSQNPWADLIRPRPFRAAEAGPGARRRAVLWLAAGFVAGYCSGLVRPTGWLLVIPGLIETARQWRDPLGYTAARLAVAISPLLGVGTFLWWAGTKYHDWMLPYSIQQLEGLRGTIATNPLPSAIQSLDVIGNGAGAFTVLLVVASIGLLWGCIKRVPVSYTLWAAVSLASVITAPHFSSFARYASGILPLLIVGAMLARERGAWRWTVFGCGALCAYFAYQSFTGIYIP